MSIGIAATVRLVAAFLHLIASLFESIGDAAVYVGDPELSTACAAVCIGLFAAGHYVKAGVALGLFCTVDVIFRDPTSAAFLGADFPDNHGA